MNELEIFENQNKLILEDGILHMIFPSGYNRILLENVSNFSVIDKEKQIYKIVYNNGKKTTMKILRISLGRFFNKPYYMKNLRIPKNIDIINKTDSDSIIASVEYIEVIDNYNNNYNNNNNNNNNNQK